MVVGWMGLDGRCLHGMYIVGVFAVVMRVPVLVGEMRVNEAVRQCERGGRKAPEHGNGEGEDAKADRPAHSEMYWNGAGSPIPLSGLLR